MRANPATAGAPVEGAPAGGLPYSRILPLKRSGPEPLYYQLAQSVERAVETGALSHGTRLLPIADMARELNVAVATVRSAWAYLERRGVLTCSRYTGTRVV